MAARRMRSSPGEREGGTQKEEWLQLFRRAKEVDAMFLAYLKRRVCRRLSRQTAACRLGKNDE